MPEKSKQVKFYDKDKLDKINPETLSLYNRYETAMILKGLSKNTITQYKADLFQWFIFIYDKQGNVSVTGLTEDDISDFLSFCQVQGNNGNRMKRRMSSISAFYKFLKKKKKCDNVMEDIERPKKVQQVTVQTYLTKEDLKLMHDKLIEYGDIQLMAYAFFSLSSMARVNAVANIKWSQVDFDKRIVHDVLEKEAKTVDLGFSNEVKELFLKMLEERKKKEIEDFGWVWYTPYITQEKPINNGTLLDWCKKIGNMINCPTLHPHDFRHSNATLLKNSGMPLEQVSKLLNHASTDVTQKFYIKEDVSKIMANKDKFEIKFGEND